MIDDIKKTLWAAAVYELRVIRTALDRLRVAGAVRGPRASTPERCVCLRFFFSFVAEVARYIVKLDRSTIRMF